MTDALSLLLQRANARVEPNGRREARGEGKWRYRVARERIELLYGTIILHFNCSLSRVRGRHGEQVRYRGDVI